MPKLNVKWVQERDFQSFPDIAEKPGFYLDVYTGDIFRNGGVFTEANRAILDAHEDNTALQRKPFLLITTDLHQSVEDVKKLAIDTFGLTHQELGKLVYSVD